MHGPGRHARRWFVLALALTWAWAPAAYAAPPANDDFATATVLSDAQSTVTGTLADATLEAGEDRLGAGPPDATGRSVWYRFTSATARTVRVATCGSSYYPGIQIYSGASLSTLTSVPTPYEPSCGINGAQVSLSAQAGVEYHIRVISWAGTFSDPSFRIALDPPPANDDVRNAAPVWPGASSISGTTLRASAEEDEPDHAGAPAEHSVWYQLVGQAGQPIVLNTCDAEFDTRLGVYGGGYGDLQELAANDDSDRCGAGSHGSYLRFTPLSSGTIHIAVDGKAGATGGFVLGVLRNDDRASASSFSGFASGDNRFATHEAGEPSHAGVAGDGSVWYRMSVTAGERVALNTCWYGLGVADTVLAVYTESGGTLTPIAANDDDATCMGGGSSVRFTAATSGEVLIAVDTKDGTAGPFYLQREAHPFNDDRATPAQLWAGMTPQSGSNGSATKEDGEPDHAGDPGGASVWYTWLPSAGHRAVEVCASSGSELHPLLGIYTTDGDGTLHEAATASGDRCARAVVTTDGMTGYLVAVDGRGGSQGAFKIGPGPGNDDFEDAWGLMSTTSGWTYGAGPQDAEPDHGGQAAGHSVWYQWNVTSYDAARLALQVCGQSSAEATLAVYRGTSLADLIPVASGRGVSSSCARTSWMRADRIDERYWVAVDTGDTGDSFTLSVASTPGNDDLAAAYELYGLDPDGSGSTAFAGREPGEADHAGAGGDASVWYRWTAPRSGRAQFDLCGSYGSKYDSALAIYRGADDALEEVASADDTPGCGDGHQPRLAFDVTSGTTYRIAVDGHQGARGDFHLRVRMRPPNDDRAQAATLSSSSGYGWLDLATREAGEPDHAGQPGGHSVWWRLTPTVDGPVSAEACGYYSPSVDTLLAVYTMAGDGSLVPVAGADDGGSCSPGAARVAFDATAGTTYYAAVDGKGGAQGDVTLRVSPVNDQFAGAAAQLDVDSFSDSADLSLATAQAGEPAHGGTPAAHSGWWSWRPSRSGLATVDTCGSMARLGVYTGTDVASLTPVTSELTSACSGGASGTRLRFWASADTTYRIAVDGTSATLRARLAPRNDRFADAQDLGTDPQASAWGTTVDAGREAGEPDHAGAGAPATVWYRWRPGRDAMATIATCGASSTLSVALYTGDALDTLTPVAAATGTDCDPDGSAVRTRVHAGTEYRIAVAGGESSFTLSAILAPVNDDRAGATTVSAPVTATGSIAYASAEADEPDHAGHQAATSLWYAVVADDDGPLTIKACAVSFTPVLAAYTENGAALASVASVEGESGGCASSRIDSGDHRAALTISATKGTRYLIALDSADGKRGYASLAIGVPANDDFTDATPLTGAHASGVADTRAATWEGDELWGSLPVTTAGSAWWTWTAPATGGAKVNTCGSTPIGSLFLAVYTGDDLATLAPVASGPGPCGADLPFDAQAGVTYRLQVVSLGNGGPVRLQVNPPDNDAFADAQPLTGMSDEANGTIAGAATEAGEPRHGADAAGRSVWYRWTAPNDGRFSVDTCGSPTPATVAIYRGSAVSALARVAPTGAQPSCPAGTPGRAATIAAARGETYRIALDGSGGAVGATLVHVGLAVDDDPPETTIDEGPPAYTNADPFTVRFSADETGATFECRLDGGPWAPCLSPLTRSLPEGAHVFAVRATDQAGNVDLTPAEWTSTVDRTAPSVTVDEQPPAIGRDRDATIRFSSDEDEVELNCARDGGTFAPCTSPLRYTDLPDGDVEVRLRARDRAGNLSAEQLVRFTVDTRPPVSRITARPSSPTNADDVTVGFDADEPGSSFACRVDSAAFTPCSSPLTLSALDEGEHIVGVRATDRAGNEEPTAAEATFVVDRTAPATTIDDGPDGLVNRLPTFAFSSSEKGSTFECAIDDEPLRGCASPHSVGALADGHHVFHVRAIDLAGNVDATPSQRAFDLDTTPPVVTFGDGPATPTAATSATFRFTVDDGDADVRCALDDTAPAPCVSPYVADDLAEGHHTLHVTATDRAGNASADRTRSIEVDRTPPDTLAGVIPDHAVNVRDVLVTFYANEGGSTFTCAVDGASASACTSPMALSDLADGEHRVVVAARDAAGNVDPSALVVTFTVDTIAPQTTITGGPQGDVHHSAGFRYEADETASTFECAFDDEPFASCDDRGDFDRLAAGAHTFRVRAVDLAGNVDGSPATRTFTIVDAPPTASLAVTPDHGAARLTVAADLEGSDPEDDTLSYRLDFGDGSPVQTGTPPATGVTHRYGDAGTYVVRLEINDRRNTAAVTQTVVVSPPEPLEANAGDDLQAVAGAPVRLDGGNSRPFGQIDEYRWDYGDGTQGTGAAVDHTYTAPGDYEAKLTVAAPGDSASDTVRIHVIAPAPKGLMVTVTSGGQAVGGADVLVVDPDGMRHAAVTDGAGHATLRGLPDGSHDVLAYAPGHQPAHGEGVLKDGDGTATVELPAGPLVKTDITSHRMTLEEIEDAGIDPNDPANQHVFQFEVHLDIVGHIETFTGYARGGGTGGSGGSGGFVGGLGFCTRLTCTHTSASTGVVVYTTIQYLPGVDAPILSSMVIPFRASFLKEFFDISLTVANLADPSFTLSHAAATLALPGGMSLAPTATPQRLTMPISDIRGGDEQTTHWIVRGDEEGEYRLSANWGATLEPFGRSVRGEATMTDPLKVWAGSALKLTVETDEVAQRGYPFTVRVGLKNVADVPVYNPAVELLREGRKGYIEQPRQQRTFSTRVVEPGETYWAGPFILVPTVSGDVNLARSFIKKTAGDVTLDSQIVTKPRVPSIDETPQMTAKGLDHKILFRWEPIDGATDYEIYRTRDRETVDFDETPLPADRVKGNPTKVVVRGVDPADGTMTYAISAIMPDGRRMVHPVDSADALVSAPSPRVSAAAKMACGQTDAKLTFDVVEDDFDLESFRWRVRGEAWNPERPLSGTEATLTATLADVPLAGATIEAQAKNSDGDWGPVETVRIVHCRYVALGDSYSSGEGVLPWGGEPGDDTCHRSTQAYARTVVERTKATFPRGPSAVEFHACSGAVTADYFAPFAANSHDERQTGENPTELPQRDYLGTDRTAQIVTLSMGGNDAHFPAILKDCAWLNRVMEGHLPHRNCMASWGPKLRGEFPELQRRLVRVYRDVLARMSPSGRLFVVGYPLIFPTGANPFGLNVASTCDSVLAGHVRRPSGNPFGLNVASTCDSFMRGDVTQMSTIQDEFDDRIGAAVAEAARGGDPARITYVDPREAFAGHSVCPLIPGQSWFNGVDALELDHTEYFFHPNSHGQEKLANLVEAAIAGRQPDASLLVKGGEYVSTEFTALQQLDDLPGRTARKLGTLIFDSGWPGSDVVMSLTSPSGRVITRSTNAADVEHEVGPTYERYVIRNAEPGRWKVSLYGADVAPGGEQTQVRMTALPSANLAPTSVYSVTGATGQAPVTARFDASDSSDVDGTIVKYAWDFGDGTSGDGAKVEHTYTSPGTYQPALTVTDNDGTATRAEYEQVTVSAPPSGGGDGGGTPAGGGPGGGSTGGATGGPAGGPVGGQQNGPTGTARRQALGGLRASKRLRLRQLKHGLTLRLTSLAPKSVARATVMLTVHGHRTSIGRGLRLRLRKTANQTVRLKLSRTALRKLRAGKLIVTVTVTAPNRTKTVKTLAIVLRR